MVNMKSRCGEATTNDSVAHACIAHVGRVHLQTKPKLNTSTNRWGIGSYISWGGRERLLEEHNPNNALNRFVAKTSAYIAEGGKAHPLKEHKMNVVELWIWEGEWNRFPKRPQAPHYKTSGKGTFIVNLSTLLKGWRLEPPTIKPWDLPKL